jgi:hypothetical protein
MTIHAKLIFTIGGPLAIIFLGAGTAAVGSYLHDNGMLNTGWGIVAVGIFVFIGLWILSWKLKLNLFKQ